MSEHKFFRREEIIGKVAINTNAEKIGEVKDIAYDSTGKIALIVSQPQGGSEKFFSIDAVVAMKDVVLLDENKATPKVLVSAGGDTGVASPPTRVYTDPPAPPSVPTVATKICQKCLKVNRAQSKFCVHCGSPL